MASSGSYSTKVGNLTLTLNWSVTSQSVVNNTSTLSVNTVLSGPYSISSSASKYGWITINNNLQRFNKAIGSHSGSFSVTLHSRTYTVPHRADGTMSVPLSAGFDPEVTYSGQYIGRMTVAGTPTLDTIPRKSTASVGTQTLGSAFTFRISRASTSFTHTIRLSMGGHTQSYTGVGASRAVTIPMSWASAIPNSTSGTVNVTLTTFSGSTNLGSTSFSFRVIVPSSVTPSGSVKVEEVGAVPASWNVYVQNKSKLRFTVSASGAYGSTIRSVVVRQGASQNIKTGTVTTFDAVYSGQVTYTITITDSRGRTAQIKHVTQTLAYSPPTIRDVTAERSTGGGTVNENGTYAKTRAYLDIDTLGGNNSATTQIHFRQVGSSGWTPAGSWTSGSYKTIGGSMSVNSRYEIRFRATDYFETVDQFVTLNTAFVTMDFLAGGRGIAMGKVAETANLLDIDFLTRLGGGIDPIRIPAGSNLNDYTTPGWYYVPYSAEAAAMANSPTAVAFELEVQKSAGISQTVRNYNTGLTYRRDNYSGWSAWRRVAGPDYENIATLDSRTNGAWTEYTPSWRDGTNSIFIGNGSIQGWYKHIGYTCDYQINIRRGTETWQGVGLYTFGLPVAAMEWWAITGTGYTSNGDTPLTARGIGISTIGLLTPTGRLSNTRPGGWAANHYIVVSGTYRTKTPGS